MTLKEYKKSLFSNFSFEAETEHRGKTKQVYQKDYDAIFIGDKGIKSRYNGDICEYDSFIDDVNKYMNSNIKFLTLSQEHSITKLRDEITKKAIDNGKIFINAYGNNNTKVFDDKENDLWISVLGVEKHQFSGKYIKRDYVNDDLSVINSSIVFAVDRSEEYAPLDIWGGTSFDQPYFAKICNKICSYSKEKGYDINRDKLLIILKSIGIPVTLKNRKGTYDLYLIKQNIELNLIDNILNTFEKETNIMIFKDVDQTKYYADEIKQITDLGIMAGDDEGNFRPEEAIKRGDLTIVISNLLKHLNEKK